MPAIITTAIEIRYIIGAIQGVPLNIRDINMAKIGSLAPHGINGVSNIVIRLSASDSIVLVAITPGIEQSVPISIGMKLLPDSPNFLNNLSIINATLAMYPESSSKDRKKKSSINCGTNVNIEPIG